MNIGSEGALTRRSFVKVGALSAALASLGSFIPQEASLAAANDVQSADPEREGTWITCDCWDNCGGRCVNKVLMHDGVPVRQKTDDTHEDSFDWPQQRACPRGHSRRNQVYATNRLRYPTKRKHWEPITGGDKSLRGRDEWERITWDEALDYVAAELKHTLDTYGNSAILAMHRPNPKKQVIHGLLSKLGGFVQELDSHSYGTFGFGMAHIGIAPMGWVGAIDRYSLLKCENIVLYAANTVWSAAGNPAMWLWEAKKQGAQFVSVGPDYNVTAALMDARWIPVRPGTDTAFLLAVAYTMVKNDEKAGNVIDWDFLHTYTVGFDAETMPADAKSDENFRGYLLGEYDGVPKTPEWATEICGTPVEDIEWYADLMSKQNSVGIFYSFGAARCYGAESFPQLIHTVGAMGGHMGRLGHACVNCNEASAFNGGTNAVTSKSNAEPLIPNPLNEWVPAHTLWRSIVEGEYTYTGNHLYGGGTASALEKRKLDIHLIWHSHQAAIGTIPDINAAIEAHRKVDFVVADNIFYTPNVQYADIVLPVCTPWESWQPGDGIAATNCDTAIFPQKIMEPLYESKSTIWVARQLAKRMGIDPDEVCLKSEEQLFFDWTAGATVTNADGTKTPLATLTQEDIDKWHEKLGIEWPTGPQQGIMSFDELLEKGVYTRKRSANDGIVSLGWKSFVDDPVKNPLKSESGKFEIYCQAYADECNMQGRSIIKPYPSYTVAPGSYQASFTDWDNKVRGEYSFQVFTPHYLRRAHSVFDNSTWLREAFPNPVFMNAGDAREMGIKEGDTVELYNERGSILRQAMPTECMMPGVLGVPHGAWPQIGDDGADRGGAENVLIGGESTGWGVSGYNTTLCGLRVYGGKPLSPDAETPLVMPEVEGEED